MPTINEKKSSVLYVLEILKKFTDKDHSLTYAMISEKLISLYGIEIERKTIARDIDILLDKGYDIVKRGNYGVYLGLRDFEDGELLYLIDALYSSKSMPTRYVKDLVDKLTSNYSIYHKKRFSHLEKLEVANRSDNKQIFYTIEILNEAIEQGKKVEFQYNSYGLDKKLKPKFEGRYYKINPYYMVNNNGKYYLICNHDRYDNIANYKIENISNIKIVEEQIKPIFSLPGQNKFSIKDYMKEHIYMLAGHSVNAILKVDNADRVNDIVDWFGDNARIFEKQDQIYVELLVNEDALIYWALQYGKKVEIIKPAETRKKMVETLEEMLQKYKSCTGNSDIR